MYEKHFSFKCKPFELVPNTDFLFLSNTHKKAITYLDYGIKEKIGFILLTGEIGAGKTTIVRNLIKNLNGSVKLSRINNTKVSSEELISMINEDFGLDVEGKSKIRLISELNEFLIENYSNKIQPILLIDEAQNLTPDLLEEIRLLSNLETEKVKLLQMILVGQPELKKTLMLPEMTQLRQRININYHIVPLTIDETLKYIKHRLTIAGNPDVIRFQGDMLKHIYQFSRGIPRLINILCDFALLTAYGEGKKEIDDAMIKEISKDLESYDYWDRSRNRDASVTASNNGDSNLLKTAGEIALRLVKLEESVHKNIKETAFINEKIMAIEERLLKEADNRDEDRLSSLLKDIEEKLVVLVSEKVAEDSRIDELLERIAELERHALVINDEKDSPCCEMDENQNLAGQAELLRKLLNHVNTKLKNL